MRSAVSVRLAHGPLLQAPEVSVRAGAAARARREQRPRSLIGLAAQADTASENVQLAWVDAEQLVRRKEPRTPTMFGCVPRFEHTHQSVEVRGSGETPQLHAVALFCSGGRGALCPLHCTTSKQGLLLFFGTLIASASYVAVIIMGILAIWIFLVRRLGKEFTQFTQIQNEAESQNNLSSKQEEKESTVLEA